MSDLRKEIDDIIVSSNLAASERDMKEARDRFLRLARTPTPVANTSNDEAISTIVRRYSNQLHGYLEHTDRVLESIRRAMHRYVI